jgi:hypothetical protein
MSDVSKHAGGDGPRLPPGALTADSTVTGMVTVTPLPW